MVNQKIEVLINQYVESDSEHGNATEQGDYKKANSNYRKNEKIFQKLLQLGKKACEELAQLLNHDNPHVRVSAATHLLSAKKKEAVRTLKKLSKESGIVSLDAKMVLQEWKKGNLKIPEWSE